LALDFFGQHTDLADARAPQAIDDGENFLVPGSAITTDVNRLIFPHCIQVGYLRTQLLQRNLSGA